jgi:hypothetical protein
MNNSLRGLVAILLNLSVVLHTGYNNPYNTHNAYTTTQHII